MNNTTETLLIFGRAIGLHAKEMESILSEGYANMGDHKNEVENIQSALPTHNLRDIYLGAALYAGLLTLNEVS